MKNNFCLPQQTIPLSKLKVPASAMERFMKKNQVQFGLNAHKNLTTAVVFSEMFDNVKNHFSSSTLDTQVEQSEPFTLPKKQEVVRMIVPQGKFHIHQEKPQRVSRSSQIASRRSSQNSRLNKTVNNMDKPIDSTIMIIKASQNQQRHLNSFHQTNYYSVESQNKTQLLSDCTQSQLEPNPTKATIQLENKIEKQQDKDVLALLDYPPDIEVSPPKTQIQAVDSQIEIDQPNYEKYLKQETWDEKSEMQVTGQQINLPHIFQMNNYLLRDIRLDSQELPRRIVKNLPKFQHDVEQTLQRFESQNETKKDNSPPIQKEVRPSSVFYPCDKDRFGRSLYPKVNRMILPGPGQYSYDENTLEHKVKIIKKRQHQQLLIKEWQDNHQQRFI